MRGASNYTVYAPESYILYNVLILLEVFWLVIIQRLFLDAI